MANELTEATLDYMKVSKMGTISKIQSRLHYGIVTPLLYRTYLTQNRLISRNELKEVADLVIPFGEAETVEFTQPAYANEYHNSIEESIGRFSLDRPFVCELPNATLIGSEAVTVASDGRLVLENSLTSTIKLAYGLRCSYPSLFKRTPDKVIEYGASFAGPRAINYYHWFVDYLPRIQGIRAYEEATGTSPTLLVPSDPPEWLRASLELLGYWDQAVEWTRGKVQVNHLIIPTGAYSSGYLTDGPLYKSPARLRWLRTHVGNAVSPDRDIGSEHVYISRDDATVRRVQNEPEVLNALPDTFKSYELTKLSLIEQIRLFSQAEAIVSPHGAGLTNMLWSYDTNILELWGVKDSDCFFQMANGLNHTYSCLACETVGDDMNVDTSELVKRIKVLF